MIIGIGTDLTALSRIESSVRRFGDRFLARVLTDGERAAMPGAENLLPHIPYIAGRFAAKEAAAKALGSGIALGVTLHDLEILRQEGGKPLLILHGAARARAEALGVTRCHLSITHERDMAAAFVILEG